MPTSNPSTQTIRSSDGSRLRLSATRLLQIDHSTTDPWYVAAADFRAAYREASRRTDPVRTIGIPIRKSGAAKFTLIVNFSLPSAVYAGCGRIGCSYFTSKVFNLIARKFKARKVRAAKAGA
jgi:hypothetical protein